MASIVGENKWHNATSSEVLQALDIQIAATQATYDNAKLKYANCISRKSSNIFYSCNKNTGRTVGEWLTVRNESYAKLEKLKAQRESLIASIGKTNEISLQSADTAQKVAVSSEKVALSFGKIALYGALVLGVIIGGVYLYKKVKK